MSRFHCSVLGLGALALVSTAVPAADAPDRARAVAEKVTAEGAALFDTYDPHAMAATYDEKAVLVILKKVGDAVEREVHVGRGKIEEAYAELLKNPETIKSRNVVERARLLAPDVLTIDGSFDTNTLNPSSLKVSFHQVRQNKDGKWLVLDMEVAYFPND